MAAGSARRGGAGPCRPAGGGVGDRRGFPACAAVRERIESAAAALHAAGARGDRRARPDLSLAEAERVAFALWVAADAADLDDGAFADLLAQAAATDPTGDSRAARRARAATAGHRDWQRLDAERRRLQRAWATFFADVDVLLCPSAPWWRRSTTPSPTRSPPWTGGSSGRSPLTARNGPTSIRWHGTSCSAARVCRRPPYPSAWTLTVYRSAPRSSAHPRRPNDDRGRRRQTRIRGQGQVSGSTPYPSSDASARTQPSSSTGTSSSPRSRHRPGLGGAAASRRATPGLRPCERLGVRASRCASRPSTPRRDASEDTRSSKRTRWQSKPSWQTASIVAR